jgi:uncharacterized membrane protein
MSEKSTQGQSHIDAIVRQEEEALERISGAQKFADAVGVFAGSPLLVLLHLLLLLMWLVVNCGIVTR